MSKLQRTSWKLILDHIQAQGCLPDFLPVDNLLRTSLMTLGASSALCSDRNCRTIPGYGFDSSRSAHDRALTTISSRSLTTSLHTPRVRRLSPVPPRVLLFKDTVLTTAARRCHRSFERAQRWIKSSRN